MEASNLSDIVLPCLIIDIAPRSWALNVNDSYASIPEDLPVNFHLHLKIAPQTTRRLMSKPSMLGRPSLTLSD